MENKSKSSKKVILGVAALVVVIAALAILYNVFREKPVERSEEHTSELQSR